MNSNYSYFLEVRYTNYVRRRPEEFDLELMPGSEMESQTNMEERLFPLNDPEREWNEIRYQRLVPGGVLAEGVPQRVYVCKNCNGSFIINY